MKKINRLILLFTTMAVGILLTAPQPVAVIRAKKKERLTLPPWIPT